MVEAMTIPLAVVEAQTADCMTTNLPVSLPAQQTNRTAINAFLHEPSYFIDEW